MFMLKPLSTRGNFYGKIYKKAFVAVINYEARGYKRLKYSFELIKRDSKSMKS